MQKHKRRLTAKAKRKPAIRILALRNSFRSLMQISPAAAHCSNTTVLHRKQVAQSATGGEGRKIYPLLADSIYRYTAGMLSMEEGRLRKNDVMTIVDDFDRTVIGSEDNMKIMCIIYHRVVWQ